MDERAAAGIIDADTIAEHWPLSNVEIGDSFPAYPSRRVLAVHSLEGTFVAKIHLGPGSSEHARQGPNVLTFLADKGFSHAPSVLPTKGGDLTVSVDAGTLCLLEFIPEQLARSDLPGADTWRALGTVAALLNAYSDCPIEHAIPIDAALAEIADSVRGGPIERPVFSLLDRLAELSGLRSTGLIHGEINFGNAACRTDGTVVFLDWDQAGTGSSVFEYSYPLIIALLSEEDFIFHGAPAEAFYSGYANAGGVINTSKVFSAALLHALRYMRFANSEQRWLRICHALEHEEELCSVLP